MSGKCSIWGGCAFVESLGTSQSMDSLLAAKQAKSLPWQQHCPRGAFSAQPGPLLLGRGGPASGSLLPAEPGNIHSVCSGRHSSLLSSWYLIAFCCRQEYILAPSFMNALLHLSPDFLLSDKGTALSEIWEHFAQTFLYFWCLILEKELEVSCYKLLR